MVGLSKDMAFSEQLQTEIEHLQAENGSCAEFMGEGRETPII